VHRSKAFRYNHPALDGCRDVIQNIEIENFKSLRRVDLKLGALNLFIGTNSSGKSNFLDALRVLQGIGYGFTFDEILNGKPKSASTEVWDGIRGGSAKVTYSGPSTNDEDGGRVISFRVKVQVQAHSLTYRITFSAKKSELIQEEFSADGLDIFSSGSIPPEDAPVLVSYSSDAPDLIFDRNMPVLTEVVQRSDRKSDKDMMETLINSLINTQSIEPVPAVLRGYSDQQSARRMGERGENFAALIKTIISDPAAKSGYLSWLQNLTPAEVDDVLILPGALGEPMFALEEQNKVFPAPLLSDGTLRFAAIAAAFFQPDMPDLLTLEEIENGIHPTRLRLLVELLRTQAVKTGRQIIATTHSPVVLAWLNDEDYETTFFCKRDENTGESIIKPLTAVPHFIDTVRKQPLGDLFAEGWLEAVL
jgi:predicted ATPase